MPDLILTFPEGACKDTIIDELTTCQGLSDALATCSLKWDEPTEPDPSWFKLPPADSQRQRVLLYLLDNAETREKIAQDLRIPDSAVDGRVMELAGGGWVVDTGEKRDTQYGRLARVVTATDKARRHCRLAPLKWFPGGVRPEACK